MYDVQIYTRYNDVYDEKNLPHDDYEVVTEYLTEHGIEADYDCTFSLYLPEKEDFHNRVKYDFPVVAISLSDYNRVREMLGYEPVSLSENEFTTQWQTIATEEERDSFLKENTPCYDRRRRIDTFRAAILRRSNRRDRVQFLHGCTLCIPGQCL